MRRNPLFWDFGNLPESDFDRRPLKTYKTKRPRTKLEAEDNPYYFPSYNVVVYALPQLFIDTILSCRGDLIQYFNEHLSLKLVVDDGGIDPGQAIIFEEQLITYRQMQFLRSLENPEAKAFFSLRKKKREWKILIKLYQYLEKLTSSKLDDIVLLICRPNNPQIFSPHMMVHTLGEYFYFRMLDGLIEQESFMPIILPHRDESVKILSTNLDFKDERSEEYLDESITWGFIPKITATHRKTKSYFLEGNDMIAELFRAWARKEHLSEDDIIWHTDATFKDLFDYPFEVQRKGDLAKMLIFFNQFFDFQMKVMKMDRFILAIH